MRCTIKTSEAEKKKKRKMRSIQNLSISSFKKKFSYVKVVPRTNFLLPNKQILFGYQNIRLYSDSNKEEKEKEKIEKEDFKNEKEENENDYDEEKDSMAEELLNRERITYETMAPTMRRKFELDEKTFNELFAERLDVGGHFLGSVFVGLASSSMVSYVEYYNLFFENMIQYPLIVATANSILFSYLVTRWTYNRFFVGHVSKLLDTKVIEVRGKVLFCQFSFVTINFYTRSVLEISTTCVI